MKNNIVNVGLIGLGRIGKMHAKNIYQRLPFLNLKSVADTKPDTEFIQNIGWVNLFENPEKIILIKISNIIKNSDNDIGEDEAYNKYIKAVTKWGDITEKKREKEGLEAFPKISHFWNKG
mgnify:CR=1 FL=1